MAARIVESVPGHGLQVLRGHPGDGRGPARRAVPRFIRDKIGLYYPINADLARLLADALNDSRWDMPYLGMQVLIEGLALAAFGVHRDMATNPLVKQMLAYVMQDEARHVAFGRLALRDYYAQLTDAERADREEFVVEGCYLMRNRFRCQEVWERMGFDVAECLEFTENSPVQQSSARCCSAGSCRASRTSGCGARRSSTPTPTWACSTPPKSDLDALMRDDEEIAERMDAEQATEFTDRAEEVHEAIAEGAAG